MGNDAKIALVIASLVFAAVGGFFIWTGYGQNVTVEAGGQLIANNQLMHIQSLKLMIGLGSAIIAAIFAMGALVVGGLERD